MISLLPLCTLLAPAASADEGLYGGASVGAFSGTFSPLGVGGAVHPRFGAWIHPNLALEAEVAAGLGGDFTAVGPLLQARFAPWEDATIRPFVVSGPGVLVTSSDLTTRSPAFAWDTGLGAMFALGDRVDLRVDGRYLVAMGRDEAELFDVDGHTELLFGIDIGFGNLTRDSDKDGLADDVDACIDDAEDMDGFEDTDGCPEADNDNDGLPDLVDSCPMDAEDVDGFADTDGCPDNDNDSDGVADVDDSCPTEAGVAALAGCPDGDGDGVADAKDLCPTEPGKANAGGCPDRDGDRVPDARDKCPDEAASKRIDPRRSDGCPSRVVVTAEAIEITETVYFDSGRATIQNRSHGLLDDVAKVLTTYTDITKV
ncbi:MAG: hypothetical protein GY882_11335 [Actinomycetia bacterium]|nr:hypothetical protein [Actinomycetes bacterium]